MKKWFAVYIRPHFEKKVAGLLSKKGLEAYCPQNRVTRVRAGRAYLVTVPLFPSWVFVRATDEDHNLLLQLEGIVNILFWRGKPAVIRDIEVDLLQRFLAEHPTVAVKKTEVNPSQIVRLVREPVDDGGTDGEGTTSMQAQVTIPSIGYILTAPVVLRSELPDTIASRDMDL